MVDVREEGVTAESVRRIAELTVRLQPLNVHVEHAPDGAAAAAFLTKVAGEIAATEALVSSELVDAVSGLTAALTAANLPWRVAAEVGDSRDAPLGVSLAALAVAETGSVLLTEATLEDRAVGMLAKTNVVVVRTESIVPSLAEAAAAIRAHALRPSGSYASLVTGPSRTADIELSLSLGVQGPERVCILVVDDLG
jgi:L-lactate dehydrogenase complex protein LldG